MSGTVNIARSLFQDEAFKDQPYTEREAFMWLVMEASWKDRTKRVGTVAVTLKRGQLAASIRFMADAWQWEKSTVDRFLKRLEKRDMIGTDSGTGVSIITIRKYAEYQGGDVDGGTAENEKRDSSGTAAGQTRIPEEIPDATHKEISPDGLLSAPPIDEIAGCVAAYNVSAVRVGWPKVQAMNRERRMALSARLRECGGKTGWEVALAKAESSDFLCGRTDKQFLASFDFLTQKRSFTRLMEGNYDNRTGGSQPNTDPTLRAIHLAAGMR